MINNVTIQGRLTDKPKDMVEVGQNLNQILYFTVAVQRDQKNTDFIECQAWNKTGEVIQKYFKKGSEIIVEGFLNQMTNKETKKNKYNVNVIKIHFTENTSTDKKENSQPSEKDEESEDDFEKIKF